MKPKNRVYCLAISRCKMLFESKDKADRFIKFNEDEIRKTGTANKRFKKLRSYYCEVCGGWHITHIKLSKKERKHKDKIVKDIIQLSKRDEKSRKELEEKKSKKEPADLYEFIRTFDLVSFGGKKKFKKHIREHQELVPSGLKLDQIYHIINEMPQECFDNLTPDSKLSKEEIESKAQELYSELPLSKLKDRKMISEYIKWEFKYKRGVEYEVINRLHELCGLR